jgi:serralysin
LEVSGDTDWFRISLVAGQTYRFDLRGSPTSDGTLSDPYMSLRNSSGTKVKEIDDGGTGYNSQFTYTATESGYFYVAAGSNNNGTGTYEVAATNITPAATDDYLSSTSTSGRLSVGGQSNGNLEVSGDTDWFRISLVAGQTYRFDLRGSSTGNGTLSDPYMSLRNSSGTKVKEIDDGGTGDNSRFTYTATESGYFYVAAGSNNNGTGTYQVAATVVTSPPSSAWTKPVGLDFLPVSGTPRINQGFGGDTSHNTQVYAVDFSAATGTAVRAVADGVVIGVRTGSTGIDTAQGGFGNYVTVQHVNGLVATYAHFSSVAVGLNGQVTGGSTVLGSSGSSGGYLVGGVPTGYAAHLHITFGTSVIESGTQDRADGTSSTGSPAFFLRHFTSTAETAGKINPADASSLRATDIFGTAEAIMGNGSPWPNTDQDDLRGGSSANRMFGGSGNDRLSGEGGKDLLVGGTGNDSMNGGLGNDTMVGGAGKDSFSFRTELSSSANRDLIEDFVVLDDTIRLDDAVFTAFSRLGALAVGAFNMGSAATQLDDRVIYDPLTGGVIYDPNGSAEGGAVQFATIGKGLTLTSEDFVII